MIEVHEILMHELPVALQIQHDPAAQTAVVHLQEAEILLKFCDELAQWRRICIECDKDIATPGFDPDRAQTAIGKIEASAVLRSEEHTSELQSLMRISYAVFCLKKKQTRLQDSDCHQYEV